MQDTGYVNIQAWMRTELNLSGNELIVYAVIYGFSQDGESRFTGSRQYLADWCGCTTRNIQIILNNLVERGLLTKIESVHNGVKSCEYVANFTTGEKISRGSEKISLYNIADNKEDSISITSNGNNEKQAKIEDDSFDSHSYSKEDFIGSVKKKTTRGQKARSLYSKCEDEIFAFTKNILVQDALIEYLKVRLANKDKPIYGVGQWIGMLNKLRELAGESAKDSIEIVKQSTERGWCSFFPVGLEYKKKSPAGELGSVNCDKDKEEEYIDEEF